MIFLFYVGLFLLLAGPFIVAYALVTACFNMWGAAARPHNNWYGKLMLIAFTVMGYMAEWHWWISGVRWSC